MLEKLITTVIYLVIGVGIIVLPLIIKAVRGDLRSPSSRLMTQPYITAVVLVGLTLWVTKIDTSHDHKLLLSWVVIACIAALAARKQFLWAALGCLMGMALASPMPWWKHPAKSIDVSWSQLGRYALISIIPLAMLMRNLVLAPAARSPRILHYLVFSAFIPVALFLSFGTGIGENYNTQIAWWHHWGAYVGPAELMLSGAHVFRDFPVQYGLGPTLAIAGACYQNCWVATYYLVGISTFLLSLLVFITALTLNTWSRLALIVLPFVTIIACFFWTSYGPAFSSPILYPSVAGLRFTPVVALVAVLCAIESSKRWNGGWQWLGHSLWMIGALWSPESLYAVSFVWWPYYCWRNVAGVEWKRVPVTLAKSISILILVFAGVLGLSLACYWVAYNELPSFDAWLAYMLYPPGPMPINRHGPIWWYGAVLVLGLAALFRTYRDQGDSSVFRRNLLVILMGYAVLSYCMGRSHDNNFLNLAPYAMLVTIGAFGSTLPITFRATAAGILGSMI